MHAPTIDTAATPVTADDTGDNYSNGPPDSPMSPSIKKRAHRVSRACDFCHSRSIRCRPSDASSASCQSCIEYDRKCTYDRPSKKRGVKSNTSRMSIPTTPTSASSTAHFDPSSYSNHVAVPPELTQAIVTDLVEVYFEIVYPLFPFFHRQTLLHRISRGEHHHDRAFFGALMALCGLTAARMRDGAVYSRGCSPQGLEKMPDSRAFFELAETAIPKEPRACESLDHLKNCALLAVLAIQNSEIRQMKFFLGMYHMLLQLEGMDQEVNWPPDLTRVEVEERRRLFWSMYMLEMFSAVCFDSTLVCREAHTTVRYPSEVDDEDLNDDESSSPNKKYFAHSAGSQASSLGLGTEGTPSWIVGWNFTIDLYRILEHALDRQKALALEESQLKARNLFHAHESSNDTVLADIMTRYRSLPQQFKEVRNVTFNPREDRYGFEAANIAATIQLVRMTLYATGGTTTRARVEIVREVLRTFSEVPIAYLRAISTPLLHHLAGIGSFLGRALQGTFMKGEYEQIRSVLVDLVELLSGLGAGSMSGDDPSQRLRMQIDKMDGLVEEQKEQLMSFPHRQLPSHQLSGLNSRDGQAGPAATSEQQGAMAMGMTAYDGVGMPVSFPPNVMDEWSWAFDFAQLAKSPNEEEHGSR